MELGGPAASPVAALPSDQALTSKLKGEEDSIMTEGFRGTGARNGGKHKIVKNWSMLDIFTF